MNEKDSVIEIDFLEILRVLIGRWWILLLCVIIVGGASYAYSEYGVPKMYISTGRMYINTYTGQNGSASENQRSTSVITASQRSVLTCIEVLKSMSVLDEVAKAVDLGYSAGQIKSMVSMVSANETEVLQITVRCNNPEHAKKIVDCLMNVATVELKNIVDIPTIKIIDEGNINRVPISPSVTLTAMIGALMGGIISAVVIAIIALGDRRIKSEEDLKNFNIPILGVIPDIM